MHKECNKKGKSRKQWNWKGNRKTKSSFSGKINKIDKPIARLTKIKREDTKHKYHKWDRRIILHILQPLKGKQSSQPSTHIL